MHRLQYSKHRILCRLGYTIRKSVETWSHLESLGQLPTSKRALRVTWESPVPWSAFGWEKDLIGDSKCHTYVCGRIRLTLRTTIVVGRTTPPHDDRVPLPGNHSAGISGADCMLDLPLPHMFNMCDRCRVACNKASPLSSNAGPCIDLSARSRYSAFWTMCVYHPDETWLSSYL